MNGYHLAQINIARLRAPIDDPSMRDFVAGLEEINALADGRPGFVWRLQGDSGNATDMRIGDDPKLLINMSLWKSVDALRQFVYVSRHRDFLDQAERWFEPRDAANLALWWAPMGSTLSPREGMQRIEHLRDNPPSPYAFTFARLFDPPQLPLGGIG